MAVTIGHASIDERGKANSGQAGDQTGKEVCTRSWYARGWTVLLRAKDPAVAEKMAKSCEAACANAHVGYDQYQRNTLRTEARKAGWDLSKITTDCETDCSAFMTVCAEAAGIDMGSAYTSGNAPVTSNMKQKFVGTGAFEALTDSKYLTSDRYLRRGDILVYEPGHTVMVLSNGDLSTSSNTSSSSGSSTGSISSSTTKPALTVDGMWGKATTTRLQQIFGTPVDGEVSNQDAAFKASNPGLCGGWDWQNKPNGRGSQLIKAMQKWAGMPTSDQDGEIGPKTIKALQTKLGTPVDGRVSAPSQMVKALQKWANNQ